MVQETAYKRLAVIIATKAESILTARAILPSGISFF
jgi:hypothetical protein